ncbi:unnamed protein product, partial [Urochloa humidicola]
AAVPCNGSSTVQVFLVFPQIWGAPGAAAAAVAPPPPSPRVVPSSAASSHRLLLRRLAGATAPCSADGSGRLRAPRRAAPPRLHLDRPRTSRRAPPPRFHLGCQELDALQRLRYPHIVRLLAFYDQQEEGVLVLEFAANGNLHERLHDQQETSTDGG